MAHETRIDGEIPIFGDDALSTEIKEFGTATDSTDINDLLSTTEAKRGWFYLGTDGFPKKEHFNALAFTLTKLLKYLYQKGIPEFNLNQEYFIGNRAIASDGFEYISKTDNNIGNTPVGDSTNWKLAFLDSANTVVYSPTANYHPATKKYVDDNAGMDIASTVEAQTGTNNTKAITPLRLHEAMLGSVKQSWQDVLSSRAVGTIYTNTTGRPIMVAITKQSDGSNTSFRVDGIIIAGVYPSSGQYNAITFIVPNSSTYEMDTGSILYWKELR